MEATILKYTVIKKAEQYNSYCDILWSLLMESDTNKDPRLQDEIDLLDLLIESWDEKHWPRKELDPVELIRAIMEVNQLKAKDIASILGVTKGLVSGILNYKRGLSKGNIRILADHFKINQEALNRPYELKGK
ncbi:MAG: transcriptional regulator [Bacteroidetes bacterium]|nr:transcriptional regulator [Bacteroidota bacterium]